MRQSAQDGHLFFVHKIHTKSCPPSVGRNFERSPTVDSEELSLCTGAGAPKAAPRGKLAKIDS